MYDFYFFEYKRKDDGFKFDIIMIKMDVAKTDLEKII